MGFISKIANKIASRVVEAQVKTGLNKEISDLRLLVLSISKNSSLEKKEKKTTKQRLADIVVNLKDIFNSEGKEAEKDNSVLFLSKMKNSTSCVISGTGKDIEISIRSACEENDSFRNLIAQVGHDIFINENVGSKDIFGGREFEELRPGIDKVNLPGGGMAFGIDPNEFSSLSKDDIDKMIDAMLKHGGIQGINPESEDE